MKFQFFLSISSLSLAFTIPICFGGVCDLTYSSGFNQNWLSILDMFAAAAAKSLQSCPTLCDPRRQPTRLPRPWDSPGKNTGVGCHFLLQCMKVKSGSEVAQSCPTPSDPMDCSLPGSSIHRIFQARVLAWVAIAFSIDMFTKCKYSYWKQIETHFSHDICVLWAFQVILVVKNLLASAGDIKDMGSNTRLGRYSGGGHGKPLQYSCLENLMDIGAWWVTIQGVTKSRTWLKWLSTYACMHLYLIP